MNEEEHYINCIGIDDKLHVCLPWEDKCKCGIRVKSKEVKSQDWMARYSCYECTY